MFTRPLYYYLALTTILSISIHAESIQNVTFFNGSENQTIALEEIAFAPTHPDCTERKPVPAVIIPKATPIIATPKAVPIILSPVPIVAPKPVPKIEPDTDGDGVIDLKDQCPDTPQGYKVDPKGCPKSVTLHINFAFASNVIPESASKDVAQLLEFMSENPACKIIIVGHTDNIGKENRNQPRSIARAKALADKLITNGIDAKRIKSSGKGSKQPIATNKTEVGRAQNRRIEIQIR